MRLFWVGWPRTFLTLIWEIIFNWAVIAWATAHVFNLSQILSISFSDVASFFPYYYYNKN